MSVGSWQSLQITQFTARAEHTSFYLSNSIYVIGGISFDTNVLSDVWYLDTQLESSGWNIFPLITQITCRYGHSTALNPTNNLAYTFGGNSGSGYLADIWSLDTTSNTWTKISTSGEGPASRQYHVTVADSIGNVYIICGVYISSTFATTYYSDTWSFNPSSATYAQLSAGISPRYGASAAYYSVHNVIYVSGGFNGDDDLNDLWAYFISSNYWIQLQYGGYIPRYGAAGCIDPAAGVLYLVAGYCDTALCADVWAYHITGTSTGEWSQLDTSGDFSSRYFPSAVLIPRNTGSATLYSTGGETLTNYYSETWTLQITNEQVAITASPVSFPTARGAPQWLNLAQLTPFTPRSEHSSFFGSSGYVYIICGLTFNTEFLSDVWYLDTNHLGYGWNIIPVINQITARAGHSTAYSVGSNMAYTFGGYVGSTGNSLGDFWSLSLSGTSSWSQISFTSGPIARQYHSSVTDSNGVVYIICGLYSSSTNGNTYLSDTWTYTPGTGTGLWSQLTATLPPRYGAVAAYYSVYNVIYVSGGTNGEDDLNDVYELIVSSGNWAQLSNAGYTARFGAAACINTVTGYWYVAAGYCGTGLCSDVWAYQITGLLKGTWSELAPTNAGFNSRYSLAAAWAPDTDSAVYFTGGQTSTEYYSDTWALTLPFLPSAAPSTAPKSSPPSPTPKSSPPSPAPTSTTPPLAPHSSPATLAPSSMALPQIPSTTLSPITPSVVPSSPSTLSPVTMKSPSFSSSSLSPSSTPSILEDNSPAPITPSSSTAQPSPSGARIADGDGGSSNSSSAIIGAVVVAVLVVTFCCVIVVVMYRRKKYESSGLSSSLLEKNESATTGSPGGSGLENALVMGNSKPRKDTVTIEKETQISVINIPWSSIKLPSGTTESHILGKGSFGSVIKAVWRPDGPTKKRLGLGTASDFPVAVKVLLNVAPSNYDKMLTAAEEEFRTLRRVHERIHFKDCTILAYGIASGVIPSNLATLLNMSDRVNSIGVVMRYEGGGSLQSLIYKTKRSEVPLPMAEKLRLLKLVARGLAELHSIGMVHADIKPDNVLLSSTTPCEVRIADFGLSMLRESGSYMTLSSLQVTSHARGTPLYCAPEMLHNPYNVYESEESGVAKSSRKTDIYAFAVLAWELLTEKVPFAQAKTDVALCAMLHQGMRPPTSEIPRDCPKNVVQLIEACWDTDRAKRKLATECYSTLQYHYGLLTQHEYDVFINHDGNQPQLACHVTYRLSQLGLNVCFKQISDDSSHTDASSTKDVKTDVECIAKSKVLLSLLSRTFQEDVRCLALLAESKKMKPAPLVLSLFIEAGNMAWRNQELNYLCQFRKNPITFDIAEAVSLINWNDSNVSEVQLEEDSVAIASCNRTLDLLAENIKAHLKNNYGLKSAEHGDEGESAYLYNPLFKKPSAT